MDEIKLINVKENILSDNEIAAEAIRSRLKSCNTFLLNLMASSFSGMTSLIMQTIKALKY